jgi:chemotaxis signal transduction protein/CheY-like chemotaxis protein
MPAVEPDTLPVLLVEESPTDRALIERALARRVTAVADAERALDAARRQSFAAILIAQALPGRSGLELLRELRASGDSTPIVVLAERGEEEEKVAASALDQGADACVVKEPGFERRVPDVVADAARRRVRARGGAAAAEPVPVHVLVFEVAEQRHALLASDVVEILPAATIAPVPGAPRCIEGMLNLRGRPVPVVDVRACFDMPRRAVEHTDHLIVVRVGDGAAALRVDRAAELAQATAMRAGATHRPRVIEHDGELLFVHDPGRLLSAEDRAALDAACGGPGGA